jgi:hypothetical protein
MTADKKTEPGAKAAASAAGTGTRKAWAPRSPVEVVLEQIGKQEKKVTELQRELDTEKSMLTKLLQAKKVLEAA